jgi:hypothetical protein
MSLHSWVTQVVQDPDNPDEWMLDLGLDLCQQLGWQVGDTLQWIDNEDGTWSLRKMS